MSPAEGFDPVLEYVRLLSDFRRPWMIAGGWAIDLFLRRVTREHEDVDIAILRADQRELRTRLRGFEFDMREFHDAVLGNGGVSLETLRRTINEYVLRVRGG